MRIHDTLFLKIRRKDLIEIIFCIIRPKFLDSRAKLILDHFMKIGKSSLTFDFCLRRKIQFTWAQLSINETNHLEPKMLGTVEGPQMSLWIKANEIEALLLLFGKEARRCFPSSQTSQCKFSTSIPLNNKGNIILRVLNDGCPRR